MSQGTAIRSYKQTRRMSNNSGNGECCVAVKEKCVWTSSDHDESYARRSLSTGLPDLVEFV